MQQLQLLHFHEISSKMNEIHINRSFCFFLSKKNQQYAVLKNKEKTANSLKDPDL